MTEKVVNSIFTTQTAIRMANKRYSIFDSLIEGVQVIDYKWQYFYVNNAIAMQGLSTKAEMLGHSMMEKYPGIENTEVFKCLQRCMLDRVSAETISEFHFFDGSTGWFELRIQPVTEGILILSSDITKLKKVEAELKKKLSERNEMLTQITGQKKQLEEFCQIIAHNLRAPLTNLLQLSEMIKESKDAEEKLHYIEIQKPVIDSLHKTFEELVNATQVRMDLTTKKKKINLEKQTNKALEVLGAEIVKSNAKVTYNFSEVSKIFYPKKYIVNIINNLLSNAIKYHSPERTPLINIRSYIKNGWVCIEVKDNGLGIDMKNSKNDLFKLHKTFHNHPNAKGFGLYITKTQIEAMGGNISAKSAPDKGSVFIVQLYKMSNDEKN